MTPLWTSTDRRRWHEALARYPDVVRGQRVAPLEALDTWYREELPSAIAARDPRHVTRDELVRATEWKMARGVWRASNLARVRGNDSALVVDRSAEALARASDLAAPITALAKLDGVGPATASAIVAAAEPERFPFFDELVAAQIPGLGAVRWTVRYYHAYADAIRERTRELGDPWTPVTVERALWAHAGGKARV